MTAPYGQILSQTSDFQAVRHALGFEPQELPDAMIGEYEHVGAGEKFVMGSVPNWQLILTLQAPAAPTSIVVNAAQGSLPASDYYVTFVRRVAKTPSAAATATANETKVAAVPANASLSIPIPNLPGDTGYDVLVGTASLQEYAQAQNVGPGSTYTLSSFSAAGQPIQQYGQDPLILKSAALAATCAMLCQRFIRRVPMKIATGNYREEIEVDWAEERRNWIRRRDFYLGQLSSFSFTPPSALTMAHPTPGPNDPNFVSGSNPLAMPFPFPFQTP